VKKKAAFIFVLLANLVILAHAVVPHHHHDEKITMVTVCHHHGEHHNHGNIPVCNEEHNDEQTAACLLSQVMLTPSNQTRTNDSPNDFETVNALHAVLAFLISNCEESLYGKQWFEIKTNLYSQLTASSVGLRAPPVC